MHLIYLILFLKIFCVCGKNSEQSNYFSVIGSKNIRANEFYEISVSSFNLKKMHQPLHLHVSIIGETVRLLQDVWVEKGTTRIISFDTLDLPAGNYQLSVIEPSTGFNDTQPLNYMKKFYSIIIQTDKPIYKPGDMVRFRVYSYNSRTQPYSLRNLTKCLVMDASNNQIFDMKDIKFNDDGVYESQFMLASKVVFGFWSMTFTGPNDEIAYKGFMVEEYMLPFNLVSIFGPSDIAIDAGSFPIIVSAVYTSSNKPANGKLKLSCTYYFNGEFTFEKNSATTGNTTFVISLAKDMKGVTTSQWDIYLSCNVQFTDDLTKKTTNDAKSITLHINKYTIEFFSQQNNIIEGFPYGFIMSVKRLDGSPIGLETKYEDRKIIVNKIAYYLNDKGEVETEIDIPFNTTFITIKAIYKGVNFERTVYKSSETQGIMLLRKERDPKLRDIVNFEVFTSEEVNYVMCLVMSKSLIMRTRKVDIHNRKGSFNFRTTSGDAPHTRIVVYYIATDGRLVGDALNMYFRSELFYKVHLSLNQDVYKPGDNMSLSVCSKRGSKVYMLAIDQRVLQLRRDDSFQPDVFMNELDNYNNNFQIGPIFGFGPVKRPGGGILHNRGFEPFFPYWSNGLTIIQNGVKSKSPWDDFKRPELANGGGALPAADKNVAFARPQPSSAVKVRSNFDETFLWRSVEVLGDCSNLNVIIPDSITKYKLIAVSVNKRFGLGMNDNDNFTVFLPFYIQLNLPYSAKRDEEISLDVLLFNYLMTPQKVILTLDKNEAEFIVLEPIKNNWKESGNTLTQSITIKPNEVKSVKLIISAKKIGFITLSLTAVGNSAGDKIKERLKIIPEGVEQNINSATTIQLKDGKTKDNKALTCVLPPNTVLDTVTVSASVVGDIIGGSMKNIDSLIRIPSGCGEQNMIIATPNALALIYLTITGQLTPEITAQGINNLLTGYQAQLTYKLDDGSFSAFGPSDGNGSTWLTAYVVKSFIQFQQFITIDQAVIDRALVFVVSKQQTDGSFIENGRVIHKDMQGAAGDGLAFTCYMTIVLKTSLPDHPQYSVEIQKALTYIIRKLSSSNDIYELLVCSYALKFNNNPAANGFKAKILALGTSTTSELHWDKSSSTGEAGSLSIEMTAYGLLYFLLDKDSGTSFRILKWLISQQNSYGGFKSTQDTVVAFQAISQIALGFRATSTNLDLIMKPNVGRTYNAHVDKSNALTQQDFALESAARSLDVQATGTGFAIVQLSCNCFVLEDNKSPSFAINLSFDGSCDNYLKFEICLNYIPKSKTDISSNMVIVEIHLPSGYQSDNNGEKSKNIDQIDTKDGGTIVEVYINSLTEKPLCFGINALRNCEISALAKSSIEIHDFYDTTKKASILYDLPKLGSCA